MACEYLSDKVISVAALLIKQQKANLANRIVLDYHNHLEQSKDMSCEEKEEYLNNYYDSNVKIYESIE